MEALLTPLNIAIVAGILLITTTILVLANRYRRCPSDKILVVFGSVGANQASRCIHGGGALVWPLIQESAYLSLTPITMSIPLQNALSQQNIRIHVPSTFTVGISTEPAIMQTRPNGFSVWHHERLTKWPKKSFLDNFDSQSHPSRLRKSTKTEKNSCEKSEKCRT